MSIILVPMLLAVTKQASVIVLIILSGMLVVSNTTH